MELLRGKLNIRRYGENIDISKKSLWAETVNTTNYVLNRCLIRLILKKTPYELFKNKKPNVSYFNNGMENLDKFDPRSDGRIFVGYSSVGKAYCVYTKHTKVIK